LEDERINIKQRQAEGIALVKSKGKQMGRPKKAIDKAFIDVYLKWKDKDITAVTVMKMLDLKPNTFYRRVKEYNNEYK
jgi:DNA invertase Pin-like site-specific DNA recombinase